MNGTVIIDTGVANLRSMEAALARAGRPAARTRDPRAVARADHAVLPGVGAFAAGVAALGDGLAAAVRARVAADRPLLAVCLGLQMLARASEEDPGTAGLGVLPADVVRLSGGRVPHLGWSPVETPAAGWPASGYAAFAHSYALPASAAPALERDGWSTARCPAYGGFVAAARRGAVLVCQFHPELSGRWGAELLAGWLQRKEAAA